MKINKVFLLIIIFLVALALRIYRLGDLPALNADEAALGYNAYSLIATGMDEHGNSWPIHFESFGDYKPGLSVYLLMPFVWLLGLNVWAVRLAPAIVGALTVFPVYFLARKIVDDRFALISAFMLSISPWHIHFSRGAWEVNIATFFIALGVLFSISKPISKRKAFLSVLFFILSLYTYHSARVVSPILFVSLLWLNKKVYLSAIKQYIPVFLLGFVFAIPLLLSLFTANSLSRAEGVSIFSDPGIVNRINERRNEYSDPSALLVRLVHNRYVYYTSEFAQNWLSHFSPNFLFFEGDEITRNKVPHMGQLYYFEIVSLLVGAYLIVKKATRWGIIIVWLAAAPVASALTFQSPHALRAQNMVVPLILISSFGLYSLTSFIKSKLFYLFILLVVIVGFVKYVDSYYRQMVVAYPYSSQYGVRELVDYVGSVHHKYDRVIVTNRYDQPYILFLFYMNYPPAIFQSEHELVLRDKFGFSTVPSFGKFNFGSVDYAKVTEECWNISCLVAGTDEEIPQSAKVVKEIYFPSGEIAFQVSETINEYAAR